jgi:hypothetical protein
MSCRAQLESAFGLRQGAAPDRMTISHAALELLVRSTASAAVLVVVDDMPWLDQVSAMILGFVARRTAGTRIGLLAPARTGEEGFRFLRRRPPARRRPVHSRFAGAVGRQRAGRRCLRASVAQQAELVPGCYRRPDDPAPGAAGHGRACRRHGHRGAGQPFRLPVPAKGRGRPDSTGRRRRCAVTRRNPAGGSVVWLPCEAGLTMPATSFGNRPRRS